MRNMLENESNKEKKSLATNKETMYWYKKKQV
jgi:hypothetical protein